MLDDPLPLIDELHGRYGDVVELRGPMLRLLLLAHPADIEQLLVGHARATTKGPTLQQVRRGMGRNLFTLEGDEHAQRRRLLTPIFRARDIEPHARWHLQRARSTAEGWTAGEPVDVSAAMDSLVLSAMAHVVLGRPHGDEARLLQQLVHESVELTPRLLDPAFAIKARAWPPHARPIDRVVERWDELCDQLVERARRTPPDPDAPVDVLHRLLEGHGAGSALLDDDAAVREELRGLLMAAHETTSLALAWTLHELARAPHVQAAVAAQVRTVVGNGRVELGHAPELGLVRAAFDEALRTHGGTFIPRGVEQDLRLDHAGITVPAGYELLASMWRVHRDARFWEKPEEFRPERFLEPDPERPRFAYFPFGGGRRTCIGMHLALRAGTVVLAELLRCWQLSPAAGDAPVLPVSNVLVRPGRPIQLVPTARRAQG
jgi:cytochrome P450